jgi:ABC-type enterochelin transport system ATPase subunit
MNAHLKLKYILTTDVKTRKKATKDVHSTVYKSLVEELNKLHYSYTDYQVLRKNCVKTLLSKIPLQNLKESTISENSEGKKQQNLLFDMMKQFDRDYIFSDSIRTPAYSYVKEYTVESLTPRMLPILLGFDKKP